MVKLTKQYATNYSLFSRIWVDNGPYQLPVISGESLRVEQAESGATVTLGDKTVRILRSDIVLQNGVMHVGRATILVPMLMTDGRLSKMYWRIQRLWLPLPVRLLRAKLPNLPRAEQQEEAAQQWNKVLEVDRDELVLALVYSLRQLLGCWRSLCYNCSRAW